MTLGKLQVIAGLAVAIGTLTGFAFAIDKRYAKQEYVQNISNRLEQKILSDRANYLQERIWKLEDRYSGREMPRTIVEDMRRLKKEQKMIERLLIIKKTKGQ